MRSLTAASVMTATIVASGLPMTALAQQTETSKCYDTWKSADANRNGVIDVGETIAGGSLNTTRDMFLAQCLQGAPVSEPPGRTSQPGVKDDVPKDLGKGDLTEGQNPFSEADAKKRLETLGYKDVQSLKLDEKGIWRATALSAGSRASVGLDAQGDVVSE